MNNKDNQKQDKNTSKNQEQIENLKDRLEEMEHNWKRALADYKNLQRRTIKEKEEAVKFSNFVLVSELIPVFDNLQMVQKHIEDGGLKMVTEQLWGVLEKTGIKKIDALGKKFNENTMEAVETEEGEKGKVLEVLQNGYKFKERLLKPAKVIVGTEKGEKSPENEKENEQSKN